MEYKPLSRQSGIVVQELENEILVYDLHLDKAFCLNETAGSVFQFCDGRNTVSEIRDLMSQSLKILVSGDLVLLTINDLKKEWIVGRV